jgi:hypothetical protein
MALAVPLPVCHTAFSEQQSIWLYERLAKAGIDRRADGVL